MEFKFKVGDFVKLKTQENVVDDGRRWIGNPPGELRGHIVTRVYEECPGGVQLHYHVRWTGSDGGIYRETHVHHEMELVASEPFPGKQGE